MTTHQHLKFANIQVLVHFRLSSTSIESIEYEYVLKNVLE